MYMGAKDMERQKLNVFRMRLLGAQVRAVTSGTATLKDATSEAIRDWVTNVETTHYILGSAAGPHPYPMMVGIWHRQLLHPSAAAVHPDMVTLAPLRYCTLHSRVQCWAPCLWCPICSCLYPVLCTTCILRLPGLSELTLPLPHGGGGGGGRGPPACAAS